MSRIYCSLDEVKRLLRSVSNRESKIRFSEAYRNLKADSSNVGTVSLSSGGIIFNDKFAEHETYTCEFTDSTSFSVVGDVLGELGSGTRTADLTLANRFQITTSAWTGGSVAGDKIYFTSASDMSNEDGYQFVVDSTKRINSYLERTFGSLSNVPFYASVSIDIPDGISFACIRFTAYDIFNSVYAGLATDQVSPVQRWKDSAEETLKQYTSGHGKGPMWMSRPLEVNKIGVISINDGVIDVDNLTDSKNKVYDR